MTLRPVNVEGFGGLNLRDDPEEIGFSQAIDLLNVDFDHRSSLRSRYGYTQFVSSAAPYTVLKAYTDGSYDRLLAGKGNAWFAYDTSGTQLATQALTAPPITIATIGTPSGNYAYVANGVDPVSKWDGAAFSSPASMPTGKYLAVQPTDSRLVLANITDVDSSLVKFSDAGAPETWTANNYVRLTPGDGDPIRGIVAWRDLLLVFKTRKYFAFYGNSTDGTGQPVFNYRAVTTGVGLAAPSCFAVAPEGVYFLDRHGVYLTNGGSPVCVSDAIAPLFASELSPSSLYAGSVIKQSAVATSGASMAYHNQRLYLSVPTGSSTTNNRVFVYTPETQNWLAWDIAAGPFAAFPLTGGEDVLMFGGTATAIHRYGSAYTTDNGTAISSRYRSGFSDLGFPGQEKTVRETELVGTGTVQFGYSRDFGAITTTSQANVTLGTSPATLRKLHRKSQDGELLSWQVNSVSGGAWSMTRLTPMVRDVRDPAELTA